MKRTESHYDIDSKVLNLIDSKVLSFLPEETQDNKNRSVNRISVCNKEFSSNLKANHATVIPGGLNIDIVSNIFIDSMSAQSKQSAFARQHILYAFRLPDDMGTFHYYGYDEQNRQIGEFHSGVSVVLSQNIIYDSSIYHNNEKFCQLVLRGGKWRNRLLADSPALDVINQNGVEHFTLKTSVETFLKETGSLLEKAFKVSFDAKLLDYEQALLQNRNVDYLLSDYYAGRISFAEVALYAPVFKPEYETLVSNWDDRNEFTRSECMSRLRVNDVDGTSSEPSDRYSLYLSRFASNNSDEEKLTGLYDVCTLSAKLGDKDATALARKWIDRYMTDSERNYYGIFYAYKYSHSFDENHDRLVKQCGELEGVHVVYKGKDCVLKYDIRYQMVQIQGYNNTLTTLEDAATDISAMLSLVRANETLDEKKSEALENIVENKPSELLYPVHPIIIDCIEAVDAKLVKVTQRKNMSLSLELAPAWSLDNEPLIRYVFAQKDKICNQVLKTDYEGADYVFALLYGTLKDRGVIVNGTFTEKENHLLNYFNDKIRAEIIGSVPCSSEARTIANAYKTAMKIGGYLKAADILESHKVRALQLIGVDEEKGILLLNKVGFDENILENNIAVPITEVCFGHIYNLTSFLSPKHFSEYELVRKNLVNGTYIGDSADILNYVTFYNWKSFARASAVYHFPKGKVIDYALDIARKNPSPESSRYIQLFERWNENPSSQNEDILLNYISNFDDKSSVSENVNEDETDKVSDQNGNPFTTSLQQPIENYVEGKENTPESSPIVTPEIPSEIPSKIISENPSTLSLGMEDQSEPSFVLSDFTDRLEQILYPYDIPMYGLPNEVIEVSGMNACLNQLFEDLKIYSDETILKSLYSLGDEISYNYKDFSVRGAASALMCSVLLGTCNRRKILPDDFCFQGFGEEKRLLDAIPKFAVGVTCDYCGYFFAGTGYDLKAIYRSELDFVDFELDRTLNSEHYPGMKEINVRRSEELYSRRNELMKKLSIERDWYTEISEIKTLYKEWKEAVPPEGSELFAGDDFEETQKDRKLELNQRMEALNKNTDFSEQSIHYGLGHYNLVASNLALRWKDDTEIIRKQKLYYQDSLVAEVTNELMEPVYNNCKFNLDFIEMTKDLKKSVQEQLLTSHPALSKGGFVIDLPLNTLVSLIHASEKARKMEPVIKDIITNQPNEKIKEDQSTVPIFSQPDVSKKESILDKFQNTRFLYGDSLYFFQSKTLQNYLLCEVYKVYDVENKIADPFRLSAFEKKTVVFDQTNEADNWALEDMLDSMEKQNLSASFGFDRYINFPAVKEIIDHAAVIRVRSILNIASPHDDADLEFVKQNYTDIIGRYDVLLQNMGDVRKVALKEYGIQQGDECTDYEQRCDDYRKQYTQSNEAFQANYVQYSQLLAENHGLHEANHNNLSLFSDIQMQLVSLRELPSVINDDITGFVNLVKTDYIRTCLNQSLDEAVHRAKGLKLNLTREQVLENIANGKGLYGVDDSVDISIVDDGYIKPLSSDEEDFDEELEDEMQDVESEEENEKEQEDESTVEELLEAESSEMPLQEESVPLGLPFLEDWQKWMTEGEEGKNHAFEDLIQKINEDSLTIKELSLEQKERLRLFAKELTEFAKSRFTSSVIQLAMYHPKALEWFEDIGNISERMGLEGYNATDFIHHAEKNLSTPAVDALTDCLNTYKGYNTILFLQRFDGADNLQTQSLCKLTDWTEEVEDILRLENAKGAEQIAKNCFRDERLKAWYSNYYREIVLPRMNSYILDKQTEVSRISDCRDKWLQSFKACASSSEYSPNEGTLKRMAASFQNFQEGLCTCHYTLKLSELQNQFREQMYLAQSVLLDMDTNNSDFDFDENLQPQLESELDNLNAQYEEKHKQIKTIGEGNPDEGIINILQDTLSQIMEEDNLQRIALMEEGSRMGHILQTLMDKFSLEGDSEAQEKLDTVLYKVYYDLQMRAFNASKTRGFQKSCEFMRKKINIQQEFIEKIHELFSQTIAVATHSSEEKPSREIPILGNEIQAGAYRLQDALRFEELSDQVPYRFTFDLSPKNLDVYSQNHSEPYKAIYNETLDSHIVRSDKTTDGLFAESFNIYKKLITDRKVDDLTERDYQCFMTLFNDVRNNTFVLCTSGNNLLSSTEAERLVPLTRPVLDHTEWGDEERHFRWSQMYEDPKTHRFIMVNLTRKDMENVLPWNGETEIDHTTTDIYFNILLSMDEEGKVLDTGAINGSYHPGDVESPLFEGVLPMLFAQDTKSLFERLDKVGNGYMFDSSTVLKSDNLEEDFALCLVNTTFPFYYSHAAFRFPEGGCDGKESFYRYMGEKLSLGDELSVQLLERILSLANAYYGIDEIYDGSYSDKVYASMTRMYNDYYDGHLVLEQKDEEMVDLIAVPFFKSQGPAELSINVKKYDTRVDHHWVQPYIDVQTGRCFTAKTCMNEDYDYEPFSDKAIHDVYIECKFPVSLYEQLSAPIKALFDERGITDKKKPEVSLSAFSLKELQANRDLLNQYIPIVVSTQTPLMQHYDVLREKHPDAVLLFRLEERYFCFREDSGKVANTLKLPMYKIQNGDRMIDAVSFRQNELDTQLPKMVRANLRVAIVDNLGALPQKEEKNTNSQQDEQTEEGKKEEQTEHREIDNENGEESDPSGNVGNGPPVNNSGIETNIEEVAPSYSDEETTVSSDEEEISASPKGIEKDESNLLGEVRYNKEVVLDQNLNAILLAARLSDDNKLGLINHAQKEVLERYIGFGGLKCMLYASQPKENWPDSEKKHYDRVMQFIEDLSKTKTFGTSEKACELLASIKNSVLTSFYTDPSCVHGITDGITTVLKTHGLQVRSMLDPCAGDNRFGTAFKQTYPAANQLSVEKDTATALVLRARLGMDTILYGGFEKFRDQMPKFDVVGSNYPFALAAVNDSAWRRNGSDVQYACQKAVHNYFALAALDRTREGGINFFITSRGFADSPGNRPFREYMVRNANLLCAVRLPDNLFMSTGGISVGSDLFIFQKQSQKTDEQLSAMEYKFIETVEKDMDGDFYVCNSILEYEPAPEADFDEVHTIGTRFFRKNQYGEWKDIYKYIGENEVFQHSLSDFIAVSMEKHFSVDAYNTNIRVKTTIPTQFDLFGNDLAAGFDDEVDFPLQDCELSRHVDKLKEGTIVELNHALGYYSLNLMGHGRFKPCAFDKVTQSTMRDYIALRDAYKALDFFESRNYSVNVQLRNTLNECYEKFIVLHGSLRDNAAILLLDAYGQECLSLEYYENGLPLKADIFHGPVAFKESSTVQSAEGAYQMSMDRYGEIRFPEMVRSLNGISQEDYLADMEKYRNDCLSLYEELNGMGLVYFNPSHIATTLESGISPMYSMLESSSLFISGDVYSKKSQATERLVNELIPNFPDDKLLISQGKKSLEILEKNKPPFVPFEDLRFNFGERWIPSCYFENYLYAISGATLKITYIPVSDDFKLVCEDYHPRLRTEYSVSLSGRSGDYDYSRLFTDALKDVHPTLYKSINIGGESVKVIDKHATIEANLKINNVRDGFRDYLQTLPLEEKDSLALMYNERFNCFVRPLYDGSYQTMPGMTLRNMPFDSLRPSQLDSVAMLKQNRGGLCAFCVGAGKTQVIICTAMEMRRLGIANKPMVVCMKANIGQIVDTFRTMYPNARILSPTLAEFGPQKRAAFFDRVKNNNWDAVIVTIDQFAKIPQSAEVQRDMLQTELNEIVAALYVMHEDGSNNKVTSQMIKGLEVRKQNLQTKLEALLDKINANKDDVCNFETMGIDHLILDESHNFKNLMFTTRFNRVAGLGNTAGAQKTYNMLCAIRTIQQKTGRDLGATFLTGTPITNSLTELYSIFKYLRPKAMEKQNITCFDAWAAVYAEKTTKYEFGVVGDVKQKERFRYYKGVPELCSFYNQITDYRDARMVGLQRPEPNVIIEKIEQTAEEADFAKRLLEFARTSDGSLIGRGELTDSEKKAHMLIATDLAVKSALDLKLVEPNAPDSELSKPSVVARKIAEYYHKFDFCKGTQFVFCDKSTPSKEKYNVYDAIKEKLVRQYHIPEKEIAFIQSAGQNAAKRALMITDMDEGRIRVLFGSTQTLGTGVNAQKHAVALHHVDTPWRPSDLEQQNGRAIRTGNMVAQKYNDNKVDIIIYGKEKSVDVYKYELLEQKATPIRQINSGSVGSRVIEDADLDEETGMSYKELAANLSGNTDMMDKARLEQELTKLELEKKIFYDGITSNERAVKSIESKIESLKKVNAHVKKDYATYKNCKPIVNVKIGGETIHVDVTSAEEASRVGKLINNWRRQILSSESIKIATYGENSEFSLYVFRAMVSGEPNHFNIISGNQTYNGNSLPLSYEKIGKYIPDVLEGIQAIRVKNDADIERLEALKDSYMESTQKTYDGQQHIDHLKAQIFELEKRINSTLGTNDKSIYDDENCYIQIGVDTELSITHGELYLVKEQLCFDLMSIQEKLNENGSDLRSISKETLSNILQNQSSCVNGNWMGLRMQKDKYILFYGCVQSEGKPWDKEKLPVGVQRMIAQNERENNVLGNTNNDWEHDM